MEKKNYVINEINSLDHLQEIVHLIQKYQYFYLNRHQEKEKIVLHFEQFLQKKMQGFQLGVFDGHAEAIGFCTVYYLPSSLSCQNYAYMSDLFVSSDYRGQGVGKILIQKALEKAKREGYGSIDWITKEDNVTAQNLYDGLGADKSLWYYYSLKH